jgi:hypothetical protein
MSLTLASRRDVLAGLSAATLAGSLGIARRSRAASADRVQIITAQGNLTAVFEEVMRSQGFFERFGLEPEMVYVTDASKMMGAILTGAPSTSAPPSASPTCFQRSPRSS